MKIVWVKANKLLPLHSGGDIRSYYIARYLASRHELRFLSYYDGKQDTEYERRLAEQFPGASCLPTGKSEKTVARIMDYVSKLTEPIPYAVSRLRSDIVKKQLAIWLDSGRFDLAVCDFLDAAANFPPSNMSTVLFQHNVESEIWRRYAARESNPAKRMLYRLEFRKMLAYEKRVVQRFSHVIAVSQHDRELMSAWADSGRISIIPTGVDLSEYKPSFSDQVAPLVIFVGAMDWEPNVDAIEFFCKEVWPTVLTRVPNAKFRIVGRNPFRRIQQLASPSIEVTGRVPAVAEHLREAAVVVVPLRIGGGTRLKIYEAMAAGKAVVSTSIGAEGLDVHNGHDIVLADEPKVFAEAVSTFLQDDGARRKYERAAAELAARYDWTSVGAEFEAILIRLMSHVSAQDLSMENHQKADTFAER
jgi:polysaccharide biosynthesis protein PslH